METTTHITANVAPVAMANTAARRVALPPGAARRVLPRWVGALIAAGVTVAVAAAFGTAAWDGYLLRREAAALEREREDLRRQNAALREEIRLLHTPEYIERVAREQLGLVRPDEIAIILVPPAPAPARTPPAPHETAREPAPERGPWWSRWWRR